MKNVLPNEVDLQSMLNAKTSNVDANFFEDVTTPAKVRQYLDSFQEADKIKGMKLLLAMLSKGKDIPEFFPDVVKNVVARSIEVKKMVYIYLVHCADFNDSCREIALPFAPTSSNFAVYWYHAVAPFQDIGMCSHAVLVDDHTIAIVRGDVPGQASVATRTTLCSAHHIPLQCHTSGTLFISSSYMSHCSRTVIDTVACDLRASVARLSNNHGGKVGGCCTGSYRGTDTSSMHRCLCAACAIHPTNRNFHTCCAPLAPATPCCVNSVWLATNTYHTARLGTVSSIFSNYDNNSFSTDTSTSTSTNIRTSANLNTSPDTNPTHANTNTNINTNPTNTHYNANTTTTLVSAPISAQVLYSDLVAEQAEQDYRMNSGLTPSNADNATLTNITTTTDTTTTTSTTTDTTTLPVSDIDTCLCSHSVYITTTPLENCAFKSSTLSANNNTHFVTTCHMSNRCTPKKKPFVLLWVLVLFSIWSSAASVADIDLSTLVGPVGFTIRGGAASDQSGYSVSAAGDVNGDGIGDVILGAQYADPVVSGTTRTDAGVSYVIFGRSKAANLAASYTNIDLLPLNTAGSQLGFAILGAVAGDNSGFSVSAAGDVNGDGMGDVIVGARLASPVVGGTTRSNAGISYVIFGRNKTVSLANSYTNIDLLPLNTAGSVLGFAILGGVAGDYSGQSVSAAGDVNGDGIGDVIVGANGADPVVNSVTRTDAGISYVIFGRSKATNLAASYANINLLNTAGSVTGFAILGAKTNDYSGISVSAAGDVNGDGIGDVIVGANGADPVVNSVTRNLAGISYVIFGRSTTANLPASYANIDLLSAGSVSGFAILGAAASDRSGYSVSAAGDVNGDGIGDVIVGAFFASPVVGGSTRSNAGISYVIFGRSKAANLAASYANIDLLLLNTAGSVTGFAILGAKTNDYSGISVSAAGDVNGDGIGDVIVGAQYADPAVGSTTRNLAGISYVIFGRGAGVYSNIDLATFISTGTPFGFRVVGGSANDYSGYSVNKAGDVNQDGVDDVIVGAYGVSTNTGASYVIFGTPPPIPSSQPSSQPSRQPSSQPSRQPTGQPTRQPSAQPSRQPVSCPTAQPSRQPSARPSRQPIGQPTAQPSSQPRSRPSSQPSNRPTAQPSCRPSAQPSSQPSTGPSAQPSQQPVSRPTAQPSSQPNSHPSSQPSSRPTAQPSRQPTGSPTRQPSVQPSSHPSRQPSSRPSNQPSAQPTSSPSVQPSVYIPNKPSALPVAAPSAPPTVLPTMRPTSQPSSQPSSMPSGSPTAQPSTHPTAQPSSVPSVQPSQQPSSSPSAQPSVLPSSQPSIQPVSAPSAQPSAQPSSIPTRSQTGLPTAQPSAQPSCIPTCCPSAQPSAQPSSVPSSQPSLPPSRQPTSQPSTQPQSTPSAAPTCQPTAQPSSVPTSQPRAGPSSAPSGKPTAQPSGIPSLQPTSQPSVLPSAQPSSQPASKPSAQTTAQPSHQPTTQPTSQPTTRPTSQPFALPTTQPTAEPSVNSPQGEWTEFASNVTKTEPISGQVWGCGRRACTLVDVTSGAAVDRFVLPWEETVAMMSVGVQGGIVLQGQTSSLLPATSSIAHCSAHATQLSCEVKSIADAVMYDACNVPLAAKVAFVGRYNVRTAIVIVDTTTFAIVLNTYSAFNIKSLLLTHVVSPPAFVGAFVAGTSTRSTGTAAIGIVLGMVRTDQSMLSAMSMLPVDGDIVSSPDLVTGITLENTLPDSFIVGGLEVSEGSVGKHAYLLRANGLFNAVKYCVRYRVGAGGGGRRALSSAGNVSSVARGVVLVGNVIYTVVDVHNADSIVTTLTVLKVLAATGDVLQQVHITAPNASLGCSDFTLTGDTLIFACQVTSNTVQSQSVLIATHLDLAFSGLPVGWRRDDNDLFHAETVPFQRSVLTVTKQSAAFAVSESTYNSGEQAPSRKPTTAPSVKPSSQPSSAPSAQPSSSPTAAPTVSARPTSQPSSATPTNSHKPTATPSPRPSLRPTPLPTSKPTVVPSVQPTVAPTVMPTARPSVHPNAVATVSPTKIPTIKPTCAPKATPTARPTRAASSAGSVGGTDSTGEGEGGGASAQRREGDINISPYVLQGVLGGAGLIGLCFLFYKLRNHVIANKELDKRRVEYYAKQEELVRANEREREKWRLQDLADQKEKAEKRARRELKAQMESARKEANSRPRGGGGGSYAGGGGAYAVSPAYFAQQESVHSDSDSSVVLSSLHSSEMSENEAITERERRQYTHSLPHSFSWESAMEEGLHKSTRAGGDGDDEDASENSSEQDGCSDDSDEESDDGKQK